MLFSWLQIEQMVEHAQTNTQLSNKRRQI